MSGRTWSRSCNTEASEKATPTNEQLMNDDAITSVGLLDIDIKTWYWVERVVTRMEQILSINQSTPGILVFSHFYICRR